MQYGDLISRSFSIVWRHKYLWLLAILGGADVMGGGGFNGNFGNLGSAFNNNGAQPASGPASPVGLQDALSAVGRFLQDNLGLLVVLGVLTLALVVAWWLLSCVTTGALVRATAEHDAERPFDLGVAWRTGLGTFRSILLLRLLGLLWVILLLGTIAGIVVLAVAAYLGGQSTSFGLTIGLGLLLVALLTLASIPIGIVFILATRAVVLEQRGPISALGRGFGLLRSRLGRVLLVWLLQVALSIATAIALTIVLIPVIVVLVAIGVGVGLSGGVGAGLAAGGVLLLVLIVLGVLAGSVVGAYLSAYWTLAFRRMEVDQPPQAAWPQSPYGPPRTA